MPEPGKAKAWIPGLDLLRCTAVFLVLIGHAKLLLPQESREQFRQLLPMPAAWGVELFFSLSGYLIGRRWVAMNLSSDEPAWRQVNRFVRNRWLRTMPTYWLLLILLLLIGAVGLGGEAPIPSLLSNLTLTNWVSGVPYALPVSWTLAIEEFSYLVIGGSVLISLPLLQRFSSIVRRRWLPLFPALLILASILIRINAVQSGEWEDLSHHPLLRIDALAYGLLLAIWVGQRSIAALGRQCWRSPWLPALLTAGLLALQHWRVSMLVDLQITTAHEAMLAASILLPSLGAITSGWVLLASAWRSCGAKPFDDAIKHLARISYSVYLVHIPLRSLMLKLWTAASFEQGLMLFGFFLLASILVGDLTYRLLEQPFLLLKQRLVETRLALSSEPVLPQAASATAAEASKH